MTTTYFANILLTEDHPMGRMMPPKRKKGDWFHSISVFTHKDINNLKVKSKAIPCTVIHFFGSNGSPVLSVLETSIRCYKIHQGTKLYSVGVWNNSAAVIGDIRTMDGYKEGYGKSNLTIFEIVTAAVNKWGNEKIPYAHQKNESYNCVAFVDDILTWAATKKWNSRIEKMHEKYGLYL